MSNAYNFALEKKNEKYRLFMKKNIKSSIIDPVHGNIPVTELEYSIIDTREFQRLRHVLQNSTAYQTYPSNTNTRFPHSVGTMHIAGKMFLNALADAPKDILRGILDKLNVAIISIEQNIKKSTSIESVEHNFNKFWIDKPAFNHRPRVSDDDDDIITLLDCCEKSNRHSDYFLICTAYEAIRIGALVHDIGHMPLSHIFEDAVSVQSDEDEFPVEHDWNASNTNNNPVSFVKILAKDKDNNKEKYQKFLNKEQKEQLSKVLNQSNEAYNSNKFELHELKGLYIFNNICKSIIDKGDIYDKLVVSLTQNILLSIPTQKGIHNDINYAKREQNSTYELYGFCHSFFANSFIDADRLDYTIRDPKSSGLNLGNLNLDLSCYMTILLFVQIIMTIMYIILLLGTQRQRHQ